MGIVKKSRFDPTHQNDEGDVDVYETSINTSTTQTSQIDHEQDFDEKPTVLSADVVDDQGDAWRSSGGAAQTTVEVANTTVDATVTVVVALVGERS